MLKDAVGNELAVGDKVGTVTSGRWKAIITGEIVRIGVQLITVEVTSAEYSGAPISSYAHLPKVGGEVRLNAFRVFRLGPCVHDRPQRQSILKAEDLRVSVLRHAAPDCPVMVRVRHLPTGYEASGEDRSELEAKAIAMGRIEEVVRKLCYEAES